jgi:hypothetical protein
LLLVITARVIMSILSTMIFPIPGELHSAARWAIILTGTNLALTLADGWSGAEHSGNGKTASGGGG